MKTIPLHVNPSIADYPWARFSVPFSRGAVRDDVRLGVVGEGGRGFPVQAWPLAYWPDGSLRVVHAVSPLPGGVYEIGVGGGEVAHADPLAIDADEWFPEGVLCGKFSLGVRVVWEDDGGESGEKTFAPTGQARGGRQGDGGRDEAQARGGRQGDGGRDEAQARGGRQGDGGRDEAQARGGCQGDGGGGEAQARGGCQGGGGGGELPQAADKVQACGGRGGSGGNIKLEGAAKAVISGPLYSMFERWVRVERGGQFLRFRLRFEFFAGVPGVVINVMLVNDCPGTDFQSIRSISVGVEGPGARQAVFQRNFGGEYLESRFVETDRALDVRVDDTDFHPYVANFEALEDPNTYPFYLRPPPDRIGGAVFLSGENSVLQFEMEDFHLLHPKGVKLAGGNVEFALWPEWAGPLKLQQGRRRQARLALRWGSEMPDSYKTAEARTAALLDVHRCQLPAEAYAGAGVFDMPRVLMHRPDLYPRFEGWLKALSVLHTPAEFFNLGDTTDGHYQTTYLPLGLCRPRPGRDPRRPRILIKSTSPQPQCFEGRDDFEPVWVNNEYDVLFCLGTEFLRSANLGLYRFLRWFARHTLEVDFLCYSDHPIHHRAQPAHSEFHTSTGAYPSHFWTQGLAQYYFLSGDDDALEVVRALADKTIWYFEHPVLGALHKGINREMGWAVLALVAAYEVTCDVRYDEWARKLIDSTITEPLPPDLPVFDFGMTSMMLGCREYIEAHRDEQTLTAPVKQWYLDLLRLAVRSCAAPPDAPPDEDAPKYSYDLDRLARGAAARGQPRPGLLPGFAALDCLAYAHELTGEVAWLEAGLRTLEAFLDGNPGYFHIPTTQSSFRAPLGEGKPFAVAYRSYINYLGALHRTGKLADFDYRNPVPEIP